MEFLIVVFLDGGDLFSNPGQLANLILDLVLEEADLILQVLNTQLIKHNYVVVSVISQEALETNGTEVIFAEGFDFFRLVNLAPTVLELADLVVTHLPLSFNCNSNIIIINIILLQMTASNQQDWKKQVNVNPADVYFSDKIDAEGKSTGSIDLVNRSNHSMVFKVKTTDPTKFIVKPNVGQLTPESSTKI